MDPESECDSQTIFFFFFFLAQNEELTLKEKFVITKVALFNVTEDKIQTYFPC